MKQTVSIGILGILFLVAASAQAADLGTAFTYQGYLENPPGTPLNDTCTFEFELCDNAGAACAPGTISSHPGIAISDGNFTVPNIDFGANSINGTARWLEITVDCGNPGDPIILAPRVELTPVPYALALPGLYTQQHALSPNIIGGYSGNTVDVGPGFYGATISGGGTPGLVNHVTNYFGTIGGGIGNTAGGYSTVGGGEANTGSGAQSTVGGGYGNTASGAFSVVTGGQNNTASSFFSTVGGGQNNNAMGNWSTVSGGVSNSASGDESCTVAGGVLNTASGRQSTVSGGLGNTASGMVSMVPGGQYNVAGGYWSFAAGRRAKARDPAASGDSDGDSGTFVWADSTDADFISTGPDRFLVRASNGTTFYSDSGLTAGVTLAAGGGSWSSVSDRNLKENFAEVDKAALLEKLSSIPVTTWNYKSQDASIRHIGPMGQDFANAFEVGEQDTRISTIDADGVALAAIQGLHELVQEKQCELDQLRVDKDRDVILLQREVSSLRSEIESLKQLLTPEIRPNGGSR